MLALWIVLMVLGAICIGIGISFIDKSKGISSDNGGPLFIFCLGLGLLVGGTTSVIHTNYYRGIALEQEWAHIEDGMFQWNHKSAELVNE